MRRIKETDKSIKEETWSSVIGRREKQKNKEDKGKVEDRSRTERKRITAQVNRRTPRTAAIQISCRQGTQYADVLKEAKEKIDIDQLGIPELRPKRARTGALLLEIPGKDGTIKANELAGKLKEVLQNNNNVLITRPEKMADIRIRDLVESTARMEVINRFAEIGECDINSIRMGEISQSLIVWAHQ